MSNCRNLSNYWPLVGPNGPPKLREVRIASTSSFGDNECASLLGRCASTLRVLVLNECVSLTNASFLHISSMRLREIQLNRCENVGDPSLRAIAEECPLIAKLSMQACDLSDGTFVFGGDERAVFRSLRFLDLGFCAKVTEVALRNLIVSLADRRTGVPAGYVTIVANSTAVRTNELHELVPDYEKFVDLRL